MDILLDRTIFSRENRLFIDTFAARLKSVKKTCHKNLIINEYVLNFHSINEISTKKKHFDENNQNALKLFKI